jgi:hypothetical protein
VERLESCQSSEIRSDSNVQSQVDHVIHLHNPNVCLARATRQRSICRNVERDVADGRQADD